MITLIEVNKPPKIEMDYLSGYISAENKKFVQKLNKKRKKTDKSLSNTLDWIILNFKEIYESQN